MTIADNFCGLAVSKHLSAVHRTLVDTLRTIGVWVIDVIVYYTVRNEAYGEKWEGKWSVVQLLGFGFLIVGTFTYYTILKYRCFNYTPPIATVLPVVTSANVENDGGRMGVHKASVTMRLQDHIHQLHFPHVHWLPWPRH